MSDYTHRHIHTHRLHSVHIPQWAWLQLEGCMLCCSLRQTLDPVKTVKCEAIPAIFLIMSNLNLWAYSLGGLAEETKQCLAYGKLAHLSDLLQWCNAFSHLIHGCPEDVKQWKTRFLTIQLFQRTLGVLSKLGHLLMVASLCRENYEVSDYATTCKQ